MNVPVGSKLPLNATVYISCSMAMTVSTTPYYLMLISNLVDSESNFR